MIVIVGCIVVIGSVLGGFCLSGGHVMALWHPTELLTIGGAAFGGMILASPKKILFDLAKCCVGTIKGSPFNKKMYRELFMLSYELLRMARRDGVLALEPHLSDPHHSAVFNKYPRFAKNHHAVQFLSDGFAPMIEGSATPEQMQGLLETEIGVIDEEHHAAVGALQKTADALPGFGIVAAVLGIVITMAAIDGPVHEIGHKVGAALVGTFLGILASYGFIAPLATRMEFLGHDELNFFKTMAYIIVACMNGGSPKVVIEQARRGVGSEVRPSRADLEQLFKDAEAA